MREKRCPLICNDVLSFVFFSRSFLDSPKFPHSKEKGRNFLSQNRPVTQMDSEPINGEVSEMIRNMQSEDATTRLESVTKMRKLLSEEDHNLPITDVINTEILLVLLRYLEIHDDPKLQIESAWLLLNFSSARTEAVVDAGAIPSFIALLDSKNEEALQEKGVWALGNIAGDSPLNRDRVLEAGGLRPFLLCLTSSRSVEMLQISSWALSNLCRGKPPPPFYQVQPAITVLNILLNALDDEILTNACWALSYLTDGTDDQIQAVVDERDIVPRVVELLDHENSRVQASALRVISHVVTGDEHQTQTVLQCPLALPHLKKLMSHGNKFACRQSLWTFSNVAAGTQQQIQAVIDSGICGEFDTLIQRGEPPISQQILNFLANASDGGTIQQLEEIFLENVSLLDFVVESLLKNEEVFQSLAMDGLINILSKASHLPSPHLFAIQLSQSSFDAIGIVQELKVVGDLLEKQTQLLELLEKAFANIGSVKPAKRVAKT